ncbi:hypothetical protein GFL18_22470 [Rhizobium leguminosarum bv. viciae]|nr:hypothetical protein [Rhizobium leguminosarum]NKL79084.1 hypothetical protein [Rhizobium leguminosarum bv. viciae]
MPSFPYRCTIDSDYRGELKVILFNASDASFCVNSGYRIAQLVIAPSYVRSSKFRRRFRTPLEGQRSR